MNYFTFAAKANISLKSGLLDIHPKRYLGVYIFNDVFFAENDDSSVECFLLKIALFGQHYNHYNLALPLPICYNILKAVFDLDFKLEIEKMRNSFAHHRNDRMSLHRPWWMFADEELSKIYLDKRILFEKGQVYYACLLQANTKLFQKFPPFDYPAQIVFSTSPHMDQNPYILRDMVEKLYSYKYSGEAPPKEWNEIVENIKNEKDRTSFLINCREKDAEFVAKMQTIMVFRKHLPSGILKGSILPVIACPEVCASVLVLPSKYWSGEFTEAWLKDL